MAGLILALGASPTVAQWEDRHSLSPLAEPVVSADAQLTANRAIAWPQAGAQLLLLDGAVTIEVGTYGFAADRAVVRIDTERQPGRLTRHLSVYLSQAKPLRGRGRVRAESDRLLVTASTTGSVHLNTNLLDQHENSPDDPLVADAARRIDRYRMALSKPMDPVATGPPLFDEKEDQVRTARRNRIAQTQATRRAAAVAALEKQLALPPQPTLKATATAAEPERRRPDLGIVSLDWQRVVYRPGDDENLVILSGGVNVIFHSLDQSPKNRSAIHLSCQNAVIFLAKGAERSPNASQYDPNDVLGVYLEQNVIVTDGRYTVRAPRVFYDPSTERAVVLDAVFYTWDAKHRVPIYVRAEKLRQRSRQSWSAHGAILTTSEFAEPHFSVAANEIHFDLRDQPDGSLVPHLSAKNIEPRIGRIGIGRWPRFEGQAGNLPIRTVDVRHDSNVGPQVKVSWDLLSLTGTKQLDGVDMTAQTDYLGNHGPAMGLNLDYEKPDLFGNMDGYWLAQDHAEDEIGGRKIEHDGRQRGFVHGRHRQHLDDSWQTTLELAYVSDPTFLEEFFRDEAETAKPYETSVYLKNQKDDWQFSLLGQYDLMNFTPQTAVLQGPGYGIEKLPELGYHRVGTSLLGDRVSYFTENRLTRMRTRPGSDSPQDRGFSTLESLVIFGQPRAVDFNASAAAAGIPNGHVTRFDTRHEVQAPLKMDLLDVVPYVAGRATFYDNDFEAFGDGGDNHRLWSIAGARFHTSFSKIDDTVENSTFDLHRIRHIIEPNVDVYRAHATIDQRDLPVYDPQVESITEGFGSRVGLRNTIQTHRGGPGRCGAR